MPARIIEELASRRQEKIAAFLTFESIVAVLIAFMPVFIISGGWPVLVRIPACLAAAVIGYALTVEVRGLPLYEQLTWTVRGLIRLRAHGDRITPEDLPGAAPIAHQDHVIAADGPIALVQRENSDAPPVARPPDLPEASDQPAEDAPRDAIDG